MNISKSRIFFKNPVLSLFYLYSPLTSCKKSEKSLEPFLRKLRYQPTNNQPTNQPIITNNTDLIRPRWRRSKNIYHYTIKICRLKIWKKRCTLDGNLNLYYICQNKAMNFLQILLKRQRLIVVLVLVIILKELV